ncbi:MAG: hypothetical protein IBJ11_05755 [Phycisphaerales bacterium]|nr:hypothetical protein [Phycisphaerales bacterium]
MLVKDGALLVADAAEGTGSPPFMNKWGGWLTVGQSGYWRDVRVMADWNGTLVAGGSITESAGSVRYVIAKLVDNRWAELPGWPSRPATALAAHGDVLIAGCEELEAAPGTQRLGAVAFWDGAAWRDFGPRVTGRVRSLASFGRRLFVGTAGHRLRWDGSSGPDSAPGTSAWIASGGGSDWASADGAGQTTPIAYSFLVEGERLVAVGSFAGPPGGPADAVYGAAEWTGSDWRPFASLQGGRDVPWFGSLLRRGDDLIAVGSFSAVDGVGATNIARFDGSGWRRLADGVSGRAFAAAEYRGTVVLAGDFRVLLPAGEASGVAVYQDYAWRPLAAGPAGAGLFTADGRSGVARDALVIGDELFVAGRFDSAGGVAARNIAAWNGASWRPLGDGLDGSVAFLASLDGAPVAAVEMPIDPVRSEYSIRRWNGSAWSELGRRQPSNVTSIAGWSGGLYLGLAGRDAGEKPPASGLRRWDGRSWVEMHEAAGWQVVSLAAAPDALWCGGFGLVGPQQGAFVARWDGGSFIPLDRIDTRWWTAPPIGGAVAFHRGQVWLSLPSISPWDGSQQTLLRRWNGLSWETAPSPSSSYPPSVYTARLFSAGGNLVFTSKPGSGDPAPASVVSLYRGGGVVFAGFDPPPAQIECMQPFSMGVRLPDSSGVTTYKWTIDNTNRLIATVGADTATVRVLGAPPGDSSVRLEVKRGCDTAEFYTKFTVQPFVGDLVQDGIIDSWDVRAMIISFGTKPDDQNYIPGADIDDNGTVGANDLIILLRSVGKRCRW